MVSSPAMPIGGMAVPWGDTRETVAVGVYRNPRGVRSGNDGGNPPLSGWLRLGAHGSTLTVWPS